MTKTAATDALIAQARQYKEEREKNYRAKALKLFPWVCGRCAREFTHSNLQELTVHHKNHNHDDNPKNGSNWELLCLYCHDNEHARFESQVRYAGNDSLSSQPTAGATFSPFIGLKDLIKK